MDLPPRRIGKRLIGSFLLLCILLRTFVLTSLVVAAAFWIISRNPDHDKDKIILSLNNKDKHPGVELKYYIEHIRAASFNVLGFGAISITLSARFTYLNSCHPRDFFGNKYAWYSVFIVTLLQFFCTHVPGVNSIIFSMAPLDNTIYITKYCLKTKTNCVTK